MLMAALGRRLLRVGPILLVVSALLFVALRLVPSDLAGGDLAGGDLAGGDLAGGDPMRPDRAWPVQYVVWLGQVLGGDLGQSTQLRRPVAALLAEALPATIELALLGMAVAGGLGLVGGLLLFAVRGAGEDAEEGAAEAAATLVMSVPEFLWALLFILVFGVLLEAMPVFGRLGPEFSRPGGGTGGITGFLLLDTLLARDLRGFASAAQHMVLPVLALGVAAAPPVMRVLCAALVAAYRAEHVRQARLRGVPPSDVLLEHALRGAVLPTLARMGGQVGALFGGALLVEVICSYPGMGRLLVEAVRNADLPVIEAVALAYCAVVLVIKAVVEGLGLLLDPRLWPR